MKFNKEVQDLVHEYNIYSRANVMLYKDDEVADRLKTLHKIDRFEFVNHCNKISEKLIPLITPYDGKSVVVKTKKGPVIHGIIEHSPIRMYEGKVLHNNVTFRLQSDGKYGIALWINTGDVMTTHLYNAENINLKTPFTNEIYYNDIDYMEMEPGITNLRTGIL